jgi:hypothetical protein
LNSGARVVCLLTGVGFKDAGALQRMAEGRVVQPITAEEILDISDTMTR